MFLPQHDLIQFTQKSLKAASAVWMCWTTETICLGEMHIYWCSQLSMTHTHTRCCHIISCGQSVHRSGSLMKADLVGRRGWLLHVHVHVPGGAQIGPKCWVALCISEGQSSCKASCQLMFRCQRGDEVFILRGSGQHSIGRVGWEEGRSLNTTINASQCCQR